MRNICMCFQLHAPYRLKRYRFFEIGQDHYYYDDYQTENRIQQLAQQSYLPANRTILDMIKSSNGKFRCAYTISGITLELLEQYAPEVIDSFRELAQTGSVEFLAEPYAHSLSSIFDINEFDKQLKLHSERIEQLFGQKPTTLCNSELIYSDELGDIAYKMGYHVQMIPGAKHMLGWKSPNYMYSNVINHKAKLLVRNPKLSDDISFRFNDHSWQDYPLDAEKFIRWISNIPEEEPIVNLWMGYETFGIRQQAYTGIFEFLKALPYFAMEQKMSFVTPAEAAKKLTAVDTLSTNSAISWSGETKNLSVWTGNDLQQEALNKLYSVGERVRLCTDKALQQDWLALQSVDHFRYMSHTDAFDTNYESPYEAFMNYMNVLSDFLQRVDEQYPTTIENEELNALLKTINNQEKEIERLEKELKAARARKSKQQE
ncbi:MAG: alpha-amylase [Bacteroidetes bacterium]|uniref:Alpha-amylase n=1 Tax=Candidatus Gallipaludibacter merdavium TaxID=2840839 RepID=A0A9D9N4I9_9BACT|nr:alpha-amylase [Candidatus Gallipaludibacter merdavium]